jgi:hypothetical protein
LPQIQQNPIIHSTNIRVAEAELLSIYTMGFTLDLLDPLFNQRSQLLSFTSNYGKAELDGILQVDQSLSQTSFNLIVSFFYYLLLEQVDFERVSLAHM